MLERLRRPPGPGARLVALALSLSRLAAGAEPPPDRVLAPPSAADVLRERAERAERAEEAKKPPPGEPTVPPGAVPVPADAETRKKAEEKATEDDGGTVLVPLVVYSPEMHLGLGAFLVQFFRFEKARRAEARPSNLAFVALVTTRKQAIFEVHPDLYWDDERNHLFGRLQYQRFPDTFWGIGPHARSSDEEQYQRERFQFRGGIHRGLVEHVYAGLYTDAMYLTARYPNPNGIFATQDVPGEDGGVTIGVGPMVTYDTRDNTAAARRGTLLSGTWLGFARAIGSRYELWKLSTEARKFFPVGEESAVAVRYYGEFQYGVVPYYQLAMLGGDELLRGYYLGRYRDKNLVALEAEYRFPIYWKFGGVAFAGAGSVAPNVLDLPLEPIRWAAGGGLRLSLNSKQRLNLRVDVGVGPGTFGAYFTAREAF